MTESLAQLLRRQRHVLTRWQALQYMSLSALRHRIDSKRWQRLYPGVFVGDSGEVGASQLVWAAVLAFGADRWPRRVGLSGLSALCVRGLTSIEPRRIQILVCRGGPSRTIRGVEVHRGPAGSPITVARGLPATSASLALVHAVAWARSDDEARLIIATSVQQRIVRPVEVERVLASFPTVRRRALLRQTIVDCSAGSESLAELGLVQLCRRAGLPLPQRQVRFRDTTGRTRYLDAVFDGFNVAVEVDGAHHLDVRHAWDDALRGNVLELSGYTVLRYPAHIVRERPQWVAAEIRQALYAAGWRPEVSRI